MDELVIKTNWQPRDILHWYELTDKERAEFDYIDTEQKQYEAEFMRYRGNCYDLHDMERGLGMSEMPQQFKEWDNYISDSFFSGILIKWVDNGERIIAARYYS